MTITQYFDPPTPPDVRRNFVCDFANNLDNGETIQSVTISVVPDGAFALDGNPVIGTVDARGRNFTANANGPCVLQNLIAGSDEMQNVEITFSITTNRNQTPSATFYANIALRS